MNEPYSYYERRRDERIARFLAQNSHSTGMKVMFLSRLGVAIQIVVISTAAASFFGASDLDLTEKVIGALLLVVALPAYADGLARIYDIGNKLIEAGKLSRFP